MVTSLLRRRREGEMGEFSPPPPPFLNPLLSFFFSYPSNIEIIFDFSDIITEIHPPFQNPGSAPDYGHFFCPFILSAFRMLVKK